MRGAEELVSWILDRPVGESGKELLFELAPLLRRMGVDWEIGSSYPALREAEAVTVQDESGATICFASGSPTRSAVLEELAHVAQGRGLAAPSDDIRAIRDRREVEAKGCLIENAETLKLPASETLETRRQLQHYREALARYEGLLQ